MTDKTHHTPPENAELIQKMVELGNLGRNHPISGATKSERLTHFREIYYGSKNQCNRHAQ